jgi:hypothetical protein
LGPPRAQARLDRDWPVFIGSEQEAPLSHRLLPATVLALALLAGAAGSARAAAPSPGPAPPHAAAPARKHVVATPGAFTMLYGDDHVFGVVPPRGWAVDDSSGLTSKLRVVLYPHGEKWATAGTVMYFSAIHFNAKHPPTLASEIQQDSLNFMKQAPRGKVTRAPLVRTDHGQTGEVRYYSREGRDNDEAVAYFMEKSFVMLAVLSSREIGGFSRALPSFRQMATSYQLVADNIATPTSR